VGRCTTIVHRRRRVHLLWYTPSLCHAQRECISKSQLHFSSCSLYGVNIDVFYILYKGTSNFKHFKGELNLSWVIPVSFGTGAVCGLTWIFLVGPIARRRVEAHVEEKRATELIKNDTTSVADPEDLGNTKEAAQSSADSVAARDDAIPAESMQPSNGYESFMYAQYKKFADSTFDQDLAAESMHENPKAAAIWANAEVFDEHAEQLFTYVQVFTACLNSCAHGANDVSNAIAPLSAIIAIYQDGYAQSSSPVQKWVLTHGGAGIVIGLFLYGYKIMKALGFKVTPLSPSRGACAELASSLFVVTASFRKIPVSSTQCIVGAVAGVGLAAGVKNVQWFMLARICVGWVFTLFIAIILSAGVFSFAAFSPSLSDSL
jgi:sodium-dependent phosphate transporter